MEGDDDNDQRFSPKKTKNGLFVVSFITNFYFSTETAIWFISEFPIKPKTDIFTFYIWKK